MSRRRTRKKTHHNDTTLWLWAIGLLAAYLIVTSLPKWTVALTVSLGVVGVAAYMYSVYIKQLEHRDGMLRLTLDEIDTMSGVEFEHYVEILFQNLGYHIQKTAVTGDFGVDLVVSKNGIKTAVQCKRYSSTIGVAAIQQGPYGYGALSLRSLACDYKQYIHQTSSYPRSVK